MAFLSNSGQNVGCTGSPAVKAQTRNFRSLRTKTKNKNQNKKRRQESGQTHTPPQINAVVILTARTLRVPESVEGAKRKPVEQITVCYNLTALLGPCGLRRSFSRLELKTSRRVLCPGDALA